MAGLYIHIPFCTQKCIYCDFMTGTNLGMRTRYIDALEREMDRYAGFFDKEAVTTLYFGGGTPSLMSIEELRRICESAASRWDLDGLEEFTIECNPDDLTTEYLEGLIGLQRSYLKPTLRGKGARLSIGVQSFNDDELKWLNRRHSAAEALNAVHNAQCAGYGNISIDLMFALPVQSMDSLNHTLDVARGLNVQHISAYSLMFEPDSKITRLMAMDRLSPLGEDLSAEMFERLSSCLEDWGYEQYEISNYAVPGFESRHNSSYWHGVPYLGLGPSAHSFDGIRRWSNAAHTVRYCGAYLQPVPCPEDIICVEEMSDDERFNEFVFTALRTRAGLALSEVEERFGCRRCGNLIEQARRFVDSGHAEIVDGRLKLTHRGIYISDSIVSEFMIVG